MKRRLLFSSNFWIMLIFIAGIGYIAALQLLVSDGAYFTGDSGLKALLTQNLAAGNLGFDIKFYDPAWVKGLWGEGFFPYAQPFVYDIVGRFYITFPYTFSLINVPFYILLGYRGLYFIPWLATLGTWIVFYLFCKKLNLSWIATAIGSLTLIFATNLALYSALYWEHTLAVFLSFTGLTILFPKKGSPAIRAKDAIWGGVLSALAVWFRPEEIFLVIFLSLISLVALVKSWRPGLLKLPDLGTLPDFIGRSGWVYPLTSFLTLCLYGLTNWLIYGDFFGVHSIQVIEQQQSLVARFLVFVGNLRLMTVGYYSLFLYVPIALFPFIYAIFSWLKPGQVKKEKDWKLWLAFCPLFVLGVALLVPAGAGGKQWGPRFLLFLVPLLVLLFTWQLDHLLRGKWSTQGSSGRILLGLVLVAGILGVIQNPIRGRDFLMQTYYPVTQTVSELRHEAEPVVAISDPFLGQVFQPAVNHNIIFLLIQTDGDLAKLSEAMVDQNLPTFSYMCYSFACMPFTFDQKSKQIARNGVLYTLQIVKAQEYGLFRIYDIQIEHD